MRALDHPTCAQAPAPTAVHLSSLWLWQGAGGGCGAQRCGVLPQHVWKVWRATREVEALTCCRSRSLLSVEREVFAVCKRAPVICKTRSLPVLYGDGCFLSAPSDAWL